MKHFAKIQLQFIKHAVLFEELTAEQQEQYLERHPYSKKQLNDVSKSITDKLDIYLNGYWPRAKAFLFTDKQTGSSFTAKNLEHAEFKLQELRKTFKAAEIIRRQHESGEHKLPHPECPRCSYKAAINIEFMKRVANELLAF